MSEDLCIHGQAVSICESQEKCIETRGGNVAIPPDTLISIEHGA